MKTIILIATLFFSVDAIGAADTTITHNPTSEPPIRYFDNQGRPLCPQDVPIVHEMDCTPYGWRWDTIEWGLMKRGLLFAPSFYVDPIHGSNNGTSLA